MKHGVAPVLLIALLAGCEESGSTAPGKPADPAALSSRLPAGSEAVVQARGSNPVKLKGFVDEAASPGGSPEGRGTLPNGTKVVVVDDSLQDDFPNIPGSRDVAVKLVDGGLGGRAVFVARQDVRQAKP
jgi:hypothetical protein